jgi:predicted tellurium resistance membrane protein TerC
MHFPDLTSPDTWIALATLSVLEIVLGIDNVIFISIVANQVEAAKRQFARRVGLILALGMRVAMLTGITWIISLSEPVVTLWGIGFSWRDVIFGAGGLFLLTKGTREIHEMVDGGHDGEVRKASSMFAVIVQIAMFDIVFSIDSVITAVGMAENVVVMIAAVILAMIVMLVASGSVADFVEKHPTVKMLALSFILMIGFSLIADAMHFHIPRGYLYFAMGFSAAVEFLNQLVARKRVKRKSGAGPEKTP